MVGNNSTKLGVSIAKNNASKPNRSQSQQLRKHSEQGILGRKYTYIPSEQECPIFSSLTLAPSDF
jgi:hypothetical protein